MSTEKDIGGRPTKYKQEYNDLAFKFCLMGATDAKLAEFFDVTETTVNNWKIEYPSFFESIKKGREKADAEIANALYHRAKGYSHTEEKIFCSDGEIVKTETVKHYPPDTAAAFIWLKNRQKWQDRHEITGAEGGALQMHVVAIPKAESRDEWLKQIGQKTVDAIEHDDNDSED